MDRNAIKFGLLAFLAAFAGWLNSSLLWFAIVLLWMSAAFGLVALAYQLAAPGLLMKPADGRQRWFSIFILWPYLLFAHFSFWNYRLFARTNVAFAEVAPGVWFGRRLLASEVVRAAVPWTSVVDLAAEFGRAPIRVAHYLSLPLMDGSACDSSALLSACDWIDEHVEAGPLLVHCAFGHGRTGSVILTWLLRTGRVTSIDRGIDLLRTLRPSFGISEKQKEAVILAVKSST